MKRSFLVEEIMLDGVSGQVRGTLEIDPYWRRIDELECHSFDFRRDDTDVSVILDETQRSAAVAVVEAVVGAATELCEEDSLLVASGQSYSPSQNVSPGTRTLSEYLSAASPRSEPHRSDRRRAQ